MSELLGSVKADVSDQEELAAAVVAELRAAVYARTQVRMPRARILHELIQMKGNNLAAQSKPPRRRRHQDRLHIVRLLRQAAAAPRLVSRSLARHGHAKRKAGPISL